MQHFICHGSQVGFANEVNSLLARGYRIIPNTTYVSSFQSTPSSETPPQFIDCNGIYHRFFFSIGLESPETTAA